MGAAAGGGDRLPLVVVPGSAGPDGLPLHARRDDLAHHDDRHAVRGPGGPDGDPGQAGGERGEGKPARRAQPRRAHFLRDLPATWGFVAQDARDFMDIDLRRQPTGRWSTRSRVRTAV